VTATHPVAPTWRDLLVTRTGGTDALPLALGVELRRVSAAGRSPWSRRRTEVATPAMVRGPLPEVHVALRPLMRSRSTGAWIRGDVSWESLRRPGGDHDPGQARWFAELHRISRDPLVLAAPLERSDWITLDGVESSLLWQHLASAEALGIPFVGTQKFLSATLARADVAVVAEPAPEGGVRLVPHVTIDERIVDVGRVRPIADSGLYLVESGFERIELTLAAAPGIGSMRTLLDAPVHVPLGETDEFLRQLPRLGRRMTIRVEGGLVVPTASPPVLHITAHHGAGDALRIDMEWRYAGIGRFDVRPTAELDLDRDPAAEDDLRARAEAAWTAVTDLPFAANATVRGVEAAEIAAQALPAVTGVDGVRVEVEGRRRDYRELTGIPEITVTSVESADPDWFDLGIIVTISGRTIPFVLLFTALIQRRTKLLLTDGAYVCLAHPGLDRLRDLIDEATALTEWEPENLRISRHQTDLWAEFEDLADEAVPAVAWRETVAGLRDTDRIAHTPPPVTLRAHLRPYQQAGLDWLAFLWRHRLGGILADDMGLGKTLQLLALIAHAREAGERRPFLVVAPTSVLSTWCDEAVRFAPDLRVSVVDSRQAGRDIALTDAAEAADVVVTTYALVRLDADDFGRVEWAGLILDEAQFVKNPATKLHRAVRELRADVVFAVTGTPLENSLVDLWALLSLTAPGLFPSARRFRKDYVGPIERGKVPENQEGGAYRAARLQRLRRRVRPLMLRRTKELVAPDLPAKQEQVQSIELAPAHRTLYDLVLQRERQKVLGLLADLDRNRFIVFRSLTLLRLLSLAPGLVDPAHSGVASRKVDALLDQLAEVAAEGHRALVFSQFTSCLGLVADRLDTAGLSYEYLDGSTRRRSEMIGRFRTGGAPVFLISLKAGGFGLTLTEADYVFLLDPWWNPAAESQAIDRTHRIGQTRAVMVYRMIAAGTIEEKVLALQQRKARLFDAVVEDDDMFAQALTADDIRGLLES